MFGLWIVVVHVAVCAVLMCAAVWLGVSALAKLMGHRTGQQQQQQQQQQNNESTTNTALPTTPQQQQGSMGMNSSQRSTSKSYFLLFSCIIS